jgi:hypothetical protein
LLRNVTQGLGIGRIFGATLGNGYEIWYWFVTLREEHRLGMSENRVLRGIFGSKREEVAGCWRRLHNEELHNLCASQNLIRVNKSRRM